MSDTFRIQMNFTVKDVGDLDEVTGIHDAVTEFAELHHFNFEGGFVEPLVDPIDYEGGSRVLAQAKPIDDEVFVDHVVGLESALSFIRDTASVGDGDMHRIYLAAQAALCQWWDHKNVRESISVYAARMARERDQVVWENDRLRHKLMEAQRLLAEDGQRDAGGVSA